MVITATQRISLKDTQLTGTLVMSAKEDVTVTKLIYEFKEIFEQAKGTHAESATYVLGSFTHPEPIIIKQLEVTSLAFAIPFDIKNGSQGDKAVYVGDMGLMNKYSDLAKQRSSVYRLEATATLEDGKEDSISVRITFQEQEDKAIS